MAKKRKKKKKNPSTRAPLSQRVQEIDWSVGKDRKIWSSALDSGAAWPRVRGKERTEYK